MPTAIARALILSSKKADDERAHNRNKRRRGCLTVADRHAQIAHDLRLKKRHAVHEGQHVAMMKPPMTIHQP